MINTSALLTSTLAMIQDDSTTLRAKALAWLNLCFQKIATHRDWLFLQKSADISATAGVITLPVDFGSFISAKQSSNWFMDKQARLSDRDADRIDAGGTTTYPAGFTQLGTTSITFHPTGSVTGTVTLKYCQSMPSYTDSASATIVPDQFFPLMQRAILDYYYEYDMDERAALSYQLDTVLLKSIIAWENRQLPIPYYEPKGYLRKA